jgi:hypothetical protein
MPAVTTLVEDLLHQVTRLKSQLEKTAYRALCEELSCQIGYEVNECDFGDIDPRTGHPRGCWCKECITELQDVRPY